MWLTNTEYCGSTKISHYHTSLNVFYHTILDYPMAFGNLTDENSKDLCCLLWIFATRIAIMLITNQHQHHDCKDDITMFDIVTQLYTCGLRYNICSTWFLDIRITTCLNTV